MFWKYFLFETKLLLRNRKNWLLGIVLLLFFPLFIYYTNQTPQDSLRDVKRAEQERIQGILEMYGPELMDGTAEQQAMYENLTKQSSLVNFQVFYIRAGEVNEDYIHNGLELTDLRLELRTFNTQGIAEHLILEEEEIMRDDAMLQFLKDNHSDVDSNLFLAENQFVLAFSLISGIPFLFYLLINASDIVVYEARHKTVMSGFPISFMKKMNVKVLIHFLHTIVFLIAGILLGSLTITKMLGKKTLNSPVLIYMNQEYQAVTLTKYIALALIGMAVIMILVFYLSILLNIVLENAYANVVIGLSIFLLPNIVAIFSGAALFLAPLKYIEFTNVLSGDLAKQLGNEEIDFVRMLIWLGVIAVLLIGILYSKNKLSFRPSKRREIHFEK